MTPPVPENCSNLSETSSSETSSSESTTEESNDIIINSPAKTKTPPSPEQPYHLPPPPPPTNLTTQPLKVLFLSSDTGGGHRASAESLAAQFQLRYPNTTYTLLDLLTTHGVPPYNQPVQTYKHLSSHPTQWKFVYGLSNSRAFELIVDAHLKLSMERAVRRRILSYDPDVIVSVHPMMTNVPVLSCRRILEETGRHLPMFTVVTDLGSAHCLWFANGVDKMFVASDRICDLAKSRGKVVDDKIVRSGLPIRHEFAVLAEELGGRCDEKGRLFQREVRGRLGLPHVERKCVLVMGGGEGCGLLRDIVDALYVELVLRGIDANVVVVCGRNDVLKTELEVRDWDAVLERHRNGESYSSSLQDSCAGSPAAGRGAPRDEGALTEVPVGMGTTGCIKGTVTQKIRRILSNTTLENAYSTAQQDQPEDTQPTSTPQQTPQPASSSTTQPGEEAEISGRVNVIGLGFVTRMAEYMIAADILVTKAGPGTIAEAASLSLPVVLTSFLPGQEEGNVDFVVDGQFGSFRSDSDPSGAAEEVASWLLDEDKYNMLSRNAGRHGKPNAAAEIVQCIGEETLRWREVNKEQERKNKCRKRDVEDAILAMADMTFDDDVSQQTTATMKTSASTSMLTSAASTMSSTSSMAAVKKWWKSRSVDASATQVQ